MFFANSGYFLALMRSSSSAVFAIIDSIRVTGNVTPTRADATLLAIGPPSEKAIVLTEAAVFRVSSNAFAGWTFHLPRYDSPSNPLRLAGLSVSASHNAKGS